MLVVNTTSATATSATEGIVAVRQTAREKGFRPRGGGTLAGSVGTSTRRYLFAVAGGGGGAGERNGGDRCAGGDWFRRSWVRWSMASSPATRPGVSGIAGAVPLERGAGPGPADSRKSSRGPSGGAVARVDITWRTKARPRKIPALHHVALVRIVPACLRPDECIGRGARAAEVRGQTASLARLQQYRGDQHKSVDDESQE